MTSSRCSRPTRRRFILAASGLVCGLLLPSCTLLNLGLMKLKFGCLPEGTRIDTPSGPIAIENLKSGDKVIGFSGSEVQITQIHQYLEDPATSRYLTLHFSNGSKISASPRHRINGIPASDFKVGDSCEGQSITSIQTLHQVSRSFDLLTEDDGYRIGNIPVNSMIREMVGR